MLTINGYVIHAVVPVFGVSGIAGYVIAGENGREAASATVRALTDREWNAGRYFRADSPRFAGDLGAALAAAVASAHQRAAQWQERMTVGTNGRRQAAESSAGDVRAGEAGESGE